MCLQDIHYVFSERSTSYNLRCSSKLQLLKPRTDYIKRSYEYSGVILWNDFPESI